MQPWRRRSLTGPPADQRRGTGRSGNSQKRSVSVGGRTRRVVRSQWPIPMVAAIFLVAPMLVAAGFWRRGAFLIGVGVGVAAVLRLVLSGRIGLLVVQTKSLDFATMATIGLVMVYASRTPSAPGDQLGQRGPRTRRCGQRDAPRRRPARVVASSVRTSSRVRVRASAGGDAVTARGRRSRSAPGDDVVRPLHPVGLHVGERGGQNDGGVGPVVLQADDVPGIPPSRVVRRGRSTAARGGHCDAAPVRSPRRPVRDRTMPGLRHQGRQCCCPANGMCSAVPNQGGGVRVCAQHVEQFCDRVDGSPRRAALDQSAGELCRFRPPDRDVAHWRARPVANSQSAASGRMGQPAPLVGGGLRTERQRTLPLRPRRSSLPVAFGQGQGLADQVAHRLGFDQEAVVTVDRLNDVQAAAARQRGRPVPAAGAAGRNRSEVIPPTTAGTRHERSAAATPPRPQPTSGWTGSR